MAKVKTNVSRSQKPKSVKTARDIVSSSAETKPEWSVRAISNGFVATKTWTDKSGKYHREEVFHEQNPISEKNLEEGD